MKNNQERLINVRDEAVKNGFITASEQDPVYRHINELINNAGLEMKNNTAEQIKYNNAIRDMDLKNYESLISLLDRTGDKYKRIRSLIDVHKNEASDELILNEIENNTAKIEASKNNLKTLKKQIKEKVMGELYGGTDEWGLGLDEANADLLIDYMVNKPAEIPAFLKSITGKEDISELTYPELFEDVASMSKTADSIYQYMADSESLANELIQKRINSVNDLLEKYQKEKNIKDRTYAIEKARYNLEKAKNNLTKKVWDGNQWVYTADIEAVQSAQEAYDNAQIDELVNTGRDLIEVLEELMQNWNLYDDYGNQIFSADAQIIKDYLEKNVPSLTLPFNIPQIAMPKLPVNNSENVHVENSFDKLELTLPNINDSSNAYNLANGLINELNKLSTYSKQYDWNK